MTVDRVKTIGAVLWFPLFIALAYAGQSGVAVASWLTAGMMAVTAFAVIWWMWRPARRAKPEGYVGKFQRPDGTVVHVARLRDARLTVVSDTQPPQDLGNVEGRELTHWQKLATEPDG
jgi:hypothetical protein